MTCRRNHRRFGMMAAVLAVCVGLVALTPHMAAAKTVWGDATAEIATEPGFEGYWRYTLEISWDTTEIGGHGMSNLGFFLSLGVCYCACHPGIVLFNDVPGTGVGVNGCELSFIGEYQCEADPNYPEKGATVKFEHGESGCEPDWNGSATLIFYSMFGPGDPQTHQGAIGIKAATYTDEGTIFGVLPLCECGNPAEHASWGTVKALYR